MGFRKYDHVERFGTDEVEGIEIGEVFVFPKLDGTNASVWIENDGSDWVICAGSRNRKLSLENDNAGFLAWASQNAAIAKLMDNEPSWTLYGEWLVPHTLKVYREDTWQRFWVFDVYCRAKRKYIHYEDYAPVLIAHNIDFIMPQSRYLSPPTEEQLWGDVNANTFLLQDGHVGEGIVIKNYFWENKYGRQPWAKLVRAEFKDENRRAFGVTEKHGEAVVEGEIAEKYVTKAFVDKTYAKITCNGGLNVSRSTLIPQLLQTCYHDIVTEEIWHAVKEHKNPTINFKKLNQFVTYWVKKHLPELF